MADIGRLSVAISARDKTKAALEAVQRRVAKFSKSVGAATQKLMQM